MEIITSPNNPRVKWAASLRDARSRRREERILIDGSSIVQHAIDGGIEVVELFVAEKAFQGPIQSRVAAWLSTHPEWRMTVLAGGAMERLQYGDRQVDVIAVAIAPTVEMGGLAQRLAARVAREPERSSELVVVLDRIEKPGNLGAILRTADAAGVSAVLMSDPVSEIWNPNAIRSSLGALFRVPLGVGTEQEIAGWLAKRGVSIFAARADGGREYDQVSYPARTAIVIGSEALGLEDRWRGSHIASIHIPMRGVVDSLNASVSGSILMFEVARQRSRRPDP